jgi:hypothetical protein
MNRSRREEHIARFLSGKELEQLHGKFVAIRAVRRPALALVESCGGKN